MTDTRTINHDHDGTEFVSVIAGGGDGPRPAVLIFHTWKGRSDFEVGHARRLAEQGYTAVAVDLYGGGKLGADVEECTALMTPLMEDRALLRARLLSALEAVKALTEVDASRIAAVGFCFGGLCALDLARSGVDVRGVASFHGLFTPTGLDPQPITAKVVAYHGWDDPMATPDTVLALAKEMSEAGADWQIHAYGNVVHSFTNPGANDRASGTAFDPDAARRSFESLDLFLKEVLA